MKGKKLVLMLVAIIVALSAAVMVACPDEPERVPGPETGTYYYEVGGKEYTLMLMDVDQFVEVNGKRRLYSLHRLKYTAQQK